MSPSIFIRTASLNDALCLRVLGMQVFLDNYATHGIRATLAREVLNSFSAESIEAALSKNDTRFLVAEQHEHLIGFAQITLACPNEFVASPSPAKLERLYVQEPFTGSGIGSALLQRAASTAAAIGAKDLWLTCWVGNHRARVFYPKHGFADLGATYFRMENEAHENRVFSKSLSSANAP